jgi:CMP-N-acetylneuraminic acid synthetase
MRVVAIIPARGGSKGVPRKNLRTIDGVPLVGRAILAAQDSALVDRIVVSTDDDEIATVSHGFGAEIVVRPAALAGDHASSESALLHALGAFDTMPEVTVFLQATSPFIDTVALDRAIARVLSGERDVVFSAFESYAFLWSEADGSAVGVNHDHSVRPRRQDREPHYQETGAFYVLRTTGFLEAGFRFFGRIGIEKVDEAGALEIDDEQQLLLASAIATGMLSDARQEMAEQ